LNLPNIHRRTDIRYVLGIALICAGLVPATLITAAQNQPLAFEVASIKQHVMTGGGFIGTRISGSLVTVSISTLKRLIQNAYQVQPYQVFGGPAWLNDSAPVYDITARAPSERTPTAEEARKMLQTLLADRFKLSFHRESREVPAHALVIGKNASKLTATAGGAPSASLAMGPTRRLTAKNMTVGQLISSISGETGRPVLDQTGLSGNYDWQLEWIANPVQSTTVEPNSASAAADLFTAVQEQLGLRLEATKTMIEVLVIDHAEKPDAN
jgi:uncharacterized protein (TIGR03435 family)